jgi:hypothetical protein
MVKEWTATLCVKQKLINRGEYWELELLALPKAAGVIIRYTTDGSSPINAGATTYAGPIRVPLGTRVVCAVAQAPAHEMASAPITISIPQKGEEARSIDPIKSAIWSSPTRFDDAAAVWDFIRRLEAVTPTNSVKALDIQLNAESAEGHQLIDYTGSIDGGYTAATLKTIADSLQNLSGSGTLRLTVSSLSFTTGQGLLDWLRATNQSVDMDKVTQS